MSAPATAATESATLKSELQARALAAGFALCRVATARPPAHGQAFRDWLAAGEAGEMAPWLERSQEKRVGDPTLVLPGTRSVIVLAMNYWQGNEGGRRKAEGGRADENLARRPTVPPPSSGLSPGHPTQTSSDLPPPAFRLPPSSGRIARYAWGGDYHDLIGEKLRALDLFLQAHGGIQKTYVDTGPVLERDFAAEAGAGWHGKSTMLIHPQLGTWFFLASILSTLELPPDVPVKDRCGACTRCLDACPTGAISRERPRHLDARRCVSYLTIELKGPIPEEFRPLIGDRIYGCDDCLEACPWNRFATASREATFQARPGTVGMALRDYLALSEEEFRVLFKGSPIKRTKRRGLLRNVCVALGNVGTAEDLPALERAAAQEEELIAEHARWAIARIRERWIGSGS